MRVLVTGSAGFLGRHFVQAHLADGDQVIGVDDLSAHDPIDVPSDVLDVTEVVNVERWCQEDLEYRIEADYDLAYHFAAPVGGRIKIEQDPLFNAESLAIDATFFRWAIQRARRVVYPSSSAVYGAHLQGDHAEKLYESQFHPGDAMWNAPDEMYGFTKLAGEVLAWKAAKYGLHTLCIRPFSGYGEGQSFDYPVPSIAARALRRENPLTIWGSGNQMRDFIHVEDIVRITRARLERDVIGYQSLNIGSGAPVSFYELARLLADIVGYKPVIQADASKPEGVTRRFASIDQMRRYGEPAIILHEGMLRVLYDIGKRIAVAA